MVSEEERAEILKEIEEAEKALAEAKADLEKARRAGLMDIVEELEPEVRALEEEIRRLRAFVGAP